MQRRKHFLVSWFHRIQFDARVRSDVWRLLRDLTREKMTESDALEAVIDIYRQKGQGGVVRILQGLRHSIARNTFNAEVNKYVTPSESLMFGARGSAKASSLYHGAFKIVETQRTMNKTIYGTILQAVLGILVVLMLYFIFGTRLFPAFVDIKPLDEWSAFPRSVARVSMAYANNLELAALCLAMGAFVLRYVIHNYTGPGRVFMDRIPPFSLYRMTTGVAFLMAVIERGRMGGALNTRLLKLMARQSSGYVRHRIEAIAELADRETGGIGSAAHKTGHGYPSPDLVLILSKYSERGGDWLVNFSAFMDSWVADIQNRIKTMAVGLNLLLLILVAGSVLMAMLSIFTIVSEIRNTQ